MLQASVEPLQRSKPELCGVVAIYRPCARVQSHDRSFDFKKARLCVVTHEAPDGKPVVVLMKHSIRFHKVVHSVSKRTDLGAGLTITHHSSWVNPIAVLRGSRTSNGFLILA